jgi:hypothetical protein
MNVDVIYQGLALVKGANARSEGGGLFVELEAPMPVGTRLELVTPEGTQAGRVESVVEGAGAGMLVGFGARKQAEPNAPMQEMKSAPVPAKAEAPAEAKTEAAEKDDEEDDKPEPSDDGGGRRKRRKPRKTVIGH